jgi:Icc-related predicted phosphoesterase
MKLLLTADLHFRIHWFRWLIEQAPSYDLVCIAGDLLDMFNVESTMGQAREVSRLIRELANIVPVMIMLADSFRMIGRQCTNGSSISARTGTSLPMVQRENLKT